MASAVGNSKRPTAAISPKAALRRRQPQCPLSAKQNSLSATRSWSPLPLRSLAVFLASCILFASLAPRASAIADDALVSASAASRAMSDPDPSSVSSASAAEDDSSSSSGRNDDGAFTEAPVHVYRDPATGKLVEEAEPERKQRQQQERDAAVALAAELDALYTEESAPVRGRGNRGAALGRKSRLGAFGGSGSSNLGVSQSAAEDKVKIAASSASDPTAAAVSASSAEGSRVTRGSRRASRRLSFH